MSLNRHGIGQQTNTESDLTEKFSTYPTTPSINNSLTSITPSSETEPLNCSSRLRFSAHPTITNPSNDATSSFLPPLFESLSNQTLNPRSEEPTWHPSPKFPIPTGPHPAACSSSHSPPLPTPRPSSISPPLVRATAGMATSTSPSPSIRPETLPSPARKPFLPPVVLDPPTKDKMNYRCKYDPALDSSVVKKSAGPQYRHFKPSAVVTSAPHRDPRLKLAYPTPLSSVPQTPNGRSSLIAGMSRCSRGRQTYHSQVENLASYPHDRNSLGPPPPPPSTAILITMLNKLVTGEQVRQHFSQYGRIAECEIKLDPQTGGSLGICWLRFVNEVNHALGRDSIHFGSKRRHSNNQPDRGLQDGHRSALEAVRKANGARIGIMLTMNAPQSTSSLRKFAKKPANHGIKCELDGEGMKSARAVAAELRRLYPPLPHPPSQDMMSAQSSGHADQRTAPSSLVDVDSFNTVAINPVSASHLHLNSNNAGAFSPASNTPNTTSNLVPLPDHPSSTFDHPTPDHDLGGCGTSSAASLPFFIRTNESLPLSLHSKTLGTAPTMPSAMRHWNTFQPSVGTSGSSTLISAASHSEYDSNSFKPTGDGKPRPSPPTNKPAFGLKTNRLLQQPSNPGPSSKSNIPESFVAEAQTAARAATKKAGICLRSQSEGASAHGLTASALSPAFENDVGASGLELSSAQLKPPANEDLSEDGDSESDDEDAREERKKEAAREALINSRKLIPHNGKVVHPAQSGPSKLPGVTPTLPQPVATASYQSPYSQLPNISLLWSHNHIGIDKSIKIEILRRLSTSNSPFLTIDRILLSRLEAETRMLFGQVQLKQYFAQFEPDQIMTDGQMWYITFTASHMAQNAATFFNSSTAPEFKLPIILQAAISPEFYQALVDNNLHPLPVSHQIATSTSSLSDVLLSDEQVVKQATEILVTELRNAFLKDLKMRFVTGRVWDVLKEEDEHTKKPSLPESQTALTADLSNRDPNTLNSVTSAILKLPSFAKRKSAQQPTGQSNHVLERSETPQSSHWSELRPDLGYGSPVNPNDLKRGSLSRTLEDDSTSVTSSEFNSANPRQSHSLKMRESTQESSRIISEDEDIKSPINGKIQQVSQLTSQTRKKGQKKRFKKAVTFTSSEEDDEAAYSPKRSKTSDENANNLQDDQGVLLPALPIVQHKVEASPSRSSSLDATLVSEEIVPSESRPTKKIRLSVSSRASLPQALPYDEPIVTTNPYDQGIAEDTDDLYYLKLVLARLRAGKSSHAPSPQAPQSPASDRDRSLRKEIFSRILASDDSKLERPLQTDQNQQGERNSHASGSSRTEGYYHIPSSQKALYLPQRNKAIIDIGAITNNSNNTANYSALALSRSTRVNSRRFVLNMEQNKKASSSASASADAVADVLKFNQLRTRKKQLKFSRSPIHDWGLYAMEMIPAGEMVIEYVGEVIRQAVADRREKAYERMGIGSSYLFRVDDDLVVDATKKGNLGRLINHCCTPNCTAKIITINGEKKIVIYAKVAIELGDEVTYDYHFPKEEVKIPCLCGSAKCKGTLN